MLKWTISRDSTLWWLALAGAVLAYVKLNGNPAHWNFDQAVDAGIAAVAWLLGKLQSSPLDSHAEVKMQQAIDKSTKN